MGQLVHRAMIRLAVTKCGPIELQSDVALEAMMQRKHQIFVSSLIADSYKTQYIAYYDSYNCIDVGID